MRRWWMLTFCILPAICFGQDGGPTRPDTTYAPCLEGQVEVRTYKSPLLASPDGRWKAYTSVEANPNGNLGCSNTSTLLVQGPGENPFRAVHTISPEPQWVGNGITPISWSNRGHSLALRALYWQNGSDAGGFSLLVYDADRKRTIEPDLAKLFAQIYTKKECAFNLTNVLGFDSRNRVLFKADDLVEPRDEEPVSETRCLASASIWALDINTDQLEFIKRSHPQAAN